MLLMLNVAPSIGAILTNHLKNNLNETFSGLEKVTSLSVATILDPRFKEVGLSNASNAQAAVERLTWERASLIDHELTEDVPPEYAATSASEEHYNLWALLDSHVESLLVSHKRSRLKPATVEKISFLNKNL
ncbi:zinc finger BED domain-containing protein 4-like [Lates japonicus]|uniref:Zinc finger BED domain-containing protein 4-like protein n=1 Tax=Lates japonicus TaxID=270547 RepID=A0AAD3R1U5_LATJO|nr:zinc finger BED domain-containing protein 4-like protein [Lates japonicus]